MKLHNKDRNNEIKVRVNVRKEKEREEKYTRRRNWGKGGGTHDVNGNVKGLQASRFRGR